MRKLQHQDLGAVTAGGRAGNKAGTAGVAPTSPVMPIQVMRYDATEIMDGITEVLAYGSAVVVERV